MNRREFLSKTSAIAAAASFSPASQTMGLTTAKPPSGRVPIIDVTDLYHPFQDPGDNLDLVYGFAFPEVDLRAVILDVTDAFRRPVANAPFLWHDPNGPREPGIVPVTQLNYVFDRQVPYAVSPFTAMRTADDRMLDIPSFQQAGIRLLLDTLEASEQPVEILSFGSTRTIAVAFNRNPELMRRKVARIHISAGTAAPHFEPSKSPAENEEPGGEWNVALDPWAFIRLLQSDLPIALYPCSTQDGAHAYGTNNTYWNFKDLNFFSRLDRRLRNYGIYALARMNRPDFLACLDGELPIEAASDRLTHPHHVWETAVWLNVTRRKLIRRANSEYAIVPAEESTAGSRVIRNSLIPCDVHVRDDGRFSFEPTGSRSNFSIFQRDDPAEYEAASREAFTALWLSFRAAKAEPA
jgi:hypothetical protein